MNLASIGLVKKGSTRSHLKGFTLIELLVVIAIIGILSAVVLASLSTARSKGKDAKIQEELSSMRAQAEIYYTGFNNSYAGVCAAAGTANPPGVATLVAAVTADSGVAATCHDGASAWAATGLLSTTHYWCVDSTGVSKDEGTTDLGSGIKAC